MSWHLARLSCVTTVVSGPIRKFNRPSGEIRPAQWRPERILEHLHQRGPQRKQHHCSLTPVRVGRHGLVFVDQGLDLVLPQAREQLLVQPGVPLLLVEELGEVLLGHGGLVGAGERGVT